MNIQELQTIRHNSLNMKIFIINNNGYHSIRQTQTNLFNGKYVGISKENGVSFPDFEKLSYAYDIPYFKISKLSDMKNLHEKLEKNGPMIIEVVVDEKQNFEPKMSSRVLPDGTMFSPELDDMFPFIDREEYENIKKIKE